MFCLLSAMPPPVPASTFKAVLWGGLAAGLGDYLFAHVHYGWRLGVFQNVAGGLLGREAVRAGGVPLYALGVGLHFGIALLWAALFCAAARRRPVLVRQAVPAGLLYGLVVYLGMNCVVLPLSALRVPLQLPPLLSWPAAAHLVLVGLPIALAARRWGGAAPAVT